MVRFSHRGNFHNTERFFNRVLGRGYLNILEKYGELGCQALAQSTPQDSGLTANSWTYEITDDGRTSSIGFLNTNENNGVNIAILLRYGHGTGTGGFVAGRDYITPALQPVFDGLANAVWKEVTGR